MGKNSSMKVVIMAGGYATRLWPITKTKAKPLLPVGRKKIIDVIYEKVKNFGRVIISTNRRFEAEFVKWSRGKDIDVVAEESTKEEEKLGAVKALSRVLSELDDDVLVVAGDNLFSFDISEFVSYYKSKSKPCTCLYDVGDYELAKRYGVAELRGDRIVKFLEKPDNPPSTLVGIGIYAFPPYIADLLDRYVSSSTEADNIGNFMTWLCKKEELYGFSFSDGMWYDIGSPDSYIEALKMFMENHVGAVEIDKHSKIIKPVCIENDVKIAGRSMIGPYACVGRGCLIENSDVCESVLFRNVILRNTTIWRSLIDDECEIRKLNLSNSIIGSHAKIQRA
jgi:glucose-1-phosphate thymidylyltransferase